MDSLAFGLGILLGIGLIVLSYALEQYFKLLKRKSTGDKT